MSSSAAIVVQGLCHRYGDHTALAGISFSVDAGGIFGLLGPNGGGKTTLFRIISTLLPVQKGSAHVLGFDVQAQPAEVRYRIGVTFQSPSLDVKLTVRENLIHQAHLYGLSGREMRWRIDQQLDRLGLSDRRADRVESLSGGLKRRVEIAKGLLHHPQILLLDEPSTGLDPGARIDLWQYLQQLRRDDEVTVMVTTHLMEEADQCDRLGILDAGQLVALGSPDELRAAVGGDCITIGCDQPEKLNKKIAAKFNVQAKQIAGRLRIQQDQGHEFLRDLVEAFSDDVTTVSLGKPTLEDVFIDRTGHRFWDDERE